MHRPADNDPGFSDRQMQSIKEAENELEVEADKKSEADKERFKTLLGQQLKRLSRESFNDRTYHIIAPDDFSKLVEEFAATTSSPNVELNVTGFSFPYALELGGYPRFTFVFDSCNFRGPVNVTGPIGGLQIKQSGRIAHLNIRPDVTDRLGSIQLEASTESRVAVSVKPRIERPSALVYRSPRPIIESLTLRAHELAEVKLEEVTVEAFAILNANIRGDFFIHHSEVKNVNFENVTFSGGLFFLRSRLGEAFFAVVRCQVSRLDVIDSRIEGAALLRDTKVNGAANFDGSTINGQTDCEGFVVSERVSWRGVTLGGPLLLRSAANLGAREADVRDVKATKFVGEDFIYCFREFRRWAEESRSQVDASRYFAYEQRAIRQTRTKFWDKSFEPVVSRLYDWISAYGTDIGRALIWFIAWNAAFALVLVLSGDANGGSSKLGAYMSPGIGLGLQNMVNPLVLFTEKPAFAPTSGLALGLSLVQSLGSIIILALLILAIRRRFHKTSE